MKRADAVYYGQIVLGSLSVAIAWRLAMFGHSWLCVPFALLAGGSAGALMSEWGWR